MNSSKRKEILGFSSDECLVVVALWLGWGFEVLFNYPSRLCFPALHRLASRNTQRKTVWPAILTSILLLGVLE